MKIELFRLVFKNIVLAQKLFNNVKDIHKLSGLRVYRWFSLINNSHSILVSLNYLSLYKQFLMKKIEKYQSNNHIDDIYNMVKYGRIDFLRYLINELNLELHECFSSCEDEISLLYECAAELNYFDIILLLDQHLSSYMSPSSYERSLVATPNHDNMEMLKWFNEKVGNSEIDGYQLETPLVTAAKKGNIEMMQWLLKHRPQDGDGYFIVIRSAFENEQLEVLHWLHENKMIPSKYKFDIVFSVKSDTFKDYTSTKSNRRLECIKWAHQNYRLNGDDFLSSSTVLTLDIIKYLYENGYKECSSIDIAALYGYIDVIQFLHEKKKDCSVHAMNLAAKYGHYELVKWLHNNRTEGFNEKALYGSSIEGHLDIFKYLINIAPTYMDYKVIGGLFDETCVHGKLNMVKYLSEYHSDKFRATTQAIDESTKYHNNIDIIKWLKENRTEGCTYKALKNSIQYGNLEIVQYLLESGLVVDYSHQDLIKTSIEYSNFDIAEWLNNKFVN